MNREATNGSGTFGALLRQHRLAAGLSQEELAERARMSVNGIGALERGDRRYPYAETVALLAEALGLAPVAAAEFAAAAARPRDPRTRPPAFEGPRTNLATQLSSFVGREAEVAEISALVNAHRLVTLVGSGGIGKTRAALRVANDRLDASSDSVWLIELAPLSSAGYLPAAVAKAMGFTLAPDGDPIEALVRGLHKQQGLLVFDNCEHLIEAAARVVAAILRGIPQLRVLATSRQALGLAGEATYRLPSLAFPGDAGLPKLTAAAAASYSAVALFVDRVQATEPRFALGDETAPAIAEICRRLDGIPLAIELAAPRLKVLGARQLRDRLDERFRLLTGGSRDAVPRQQTLRALIDWSYDLLDEREQRLFRHLGIFVNGFSIDAATAVCGSGELDDFAVFDLLASLIDKSLVLVEGNGDAPRYRLLESTRLYARERLAAADERDAAASAHLEFLHHRFAAAAAKRMQSASETEIDELLAAELDDVRAALDWAHAGHAVRRGGELLAAIGTRWYFLGLRREGSERLEAFATTLAGEDPALLARLWCSFARIADDTGRSTRGHAAAVEAVALARLSGNPAILADVLEAYARRATFENRYAEAEAALSEAEAIPEPSLLLRRSLLFVRGLLSWRQGNPAAGVRAFEQLRAVNRALGNATFNGWITLQLAEIEHESGNTQRSIELSHELLPAARAGTDRGFHATVLALLAAYLLALDEWQAAAEVAREAIDALAPHDSQARMVGVAIEQVALALALGGDVPRAARLAGYAEAAMRAIVDEREYTEGTTYRRLHALLRERLPTAELEALLAEGQTLSSEAAFALALDEM